MELHCRKSALTFLKVCLGGVANLNGNIGSEGVGIGQLSSVLLTHVDPALRRPEKEQIKVGNPFGPLSLRFDSFPATLHTAH